MSFILDALKKSEKERQREAVPAIGDLPVVVRQEHASAWTVTLIAGLGLAAAALAVAWWRASTPEPVATTTRVATPVSPAAEPTPPPVARSAAPTETRSLASEASRVAEARVRPRPAASTTPSGGATRTAGVITTGPMSITDARSAGLAVPELVLELLVYSDDPAKRFVYINSGKYVEGDALPEGPELVEITTEGAILSYRGQDYLLPQN